MISPRTLPCLHDQPSNRHRQFEAPRTCAAGIEVEHAVAHLLLRNVAVAGDHNLESGGFRLQIELREIVQHVDGNAADLDDFGLRQVCAPTRLVDIAADGGHGRDGCELLENFWMRRRRQRE